MTVIEQALEINALLAQPNLLKPPQCLTCEHWRQSDGNKRLGDCVKAGASKYGKEITFDVAGPLSVPHSDFDAIRTLSDFGCNRHSNFLNARS